ncbi:MAG TPA: class I SAM-dependent methyltransferase [Candidatus Baltobacteraceae bacterium]|jgi:ubiquinone/menaquinone biosynthesis C-methylase UbiE|nr:class I SAM-dependent methyltransferase [Candidatus Baltobacteraceae bacterium]
MYTQSAKYYDALYRALGKDYEKEAAHVREIVEQRCRSGGNALLDVGCGTGRHLEYLREHFTCEGLDVERTMLDIARDRNPDVPFHLGDMMGFNLGKRFDAIVSLFGAIGTMPNVGRLDQTLQTFARHLRPGGVVIVEPWLRPEDWKDGSVHALYVDEPDLKVARMSVSRRDGNVSILNFHYMVASRDGIRTFTEPHRLTLFTDDEYRNAFRKAGLYVEFEEPGLTAGRGLYVGYTSA